MEAKVKKTKKSKNAFKVLFLMAMWLIILVLLAFAFCQVFFPDFCFELFGIRFYLISYTKSMEPDLVFNDLIAVVKFDFELLKVDDVITFETKLPNGETIFVTHKIVDIIEDDGVKYLKTQGVNLPYPDTIPVTADGVFDTNVYVGKFALKSSFLGNMIAFLKSTLGIISTITTVIGLIAIWILFGDLKHGRE